MLTFLQGMRTINELKVIFKSGQDRSRTKSGYEVHSRNGRLATKCVCRSSYSIEMFSAILGPLSPTRNKTLSKRKRRLTTHHRKFC